MNPNSFVGHQLWSTYHLVTMVMTYFFHQFFPVLLFSNMADQSCHFYVFLPEIFDSLIDILLFAAAHNNLSPIQPESPCNCISYSEKNIQIMLAFFKDLFFFLIFTFCCSFIYFSSLYEQKEKCSCNGQ